MPTRRTILSMLALVALLAAGAAAVAFGGDSATAEGSNQPTRAWVTPTAGPPAPPTLELDAPPDAHPVIWVRQGESVEVRDAPGGALLEVARKRTEFGSPTVFSVVRHRGSWAGVTTPAAGNGSLGWVKLDPERLRAGWTRGAIEVDLSEREARLVEGGELVVSFAVTIGAPEFETPTGRFAITDTFRGDLDPAYGCCALATSAVQPRLPSGWFDGNRIAIHGTSGTLGIAASHGCLRAADAALEKLLGRVSLGTPVFIRA